MLICVWVQGSGVSRVWQAGHVPWAPLAGGAIWLGALVPMSNQVNKKIINLLKLIINKHSFKYFKGGAI
jgi:hypothetical protein